MQDKKKCSQCKRWLPVNQKNPDNDGFYRNSKNGYYQSPCKECRIKYSRKVAKDNSASKFKLKVLKLDWYICRGCGSRKDVTAHHIVFRSQGGGNSVGNGIALCPDCHRIVHEGDGSGKNRVTGRGFMLVVLERHRGKPYWRWESAYNHLKKREK